MPLVHLHKKKKAIQLRLQGKSYGEILKILELPSKGTLSAWFRDLKLTPIAQKRLQHNTDIAYQKGFFAFNKKRKEAIQTENQSIFEEARKEVAALSAQHLLLIGASLYWAEGTSRPQPGRYHYVAFANADAKMSAVFMQYLREILKVPEDHIKPGIMIYPNLDPDIAKNFWSEVLKLPREKFWISVSTSRASKGKRPVNFLPYGTVQIRVNRRQVFHKIQGHIAGIFEQLK